MYKYIYLIFFCCNFINAQDIVSGAVYGDNTDNPLPGANVYWLSSNKGAVTDINGMFSLDSDPASTKLVISYIGYISDTLSVRESRQINHVLKVKK